MVEFDESPASRSEYRFVKKCKGLDRLRRKHGLELYFLTATVRNEDADSMNREISRLLNFIRMRFRRAGLEVYYAWVVELQKKRYTKTGVLALHWHIAIICNRGTLPDVGYRDPKHHRGLYVREQGSVVSMDDLVKFWGKGLVFSQIAISPTVYGYLSKYFTKSEAEFRLKEEWKNLRRFGASQMQHNAYPQWAFDAVENAIAESVDYKYFKHGSRIDFLRIDADGCGERFTFKSPYVLVSKNPRPLSTSG